MVTSNKRVDLSESESFIRLFAAETLARKNTGTGVPLSLLAFADDLVAPPPRTRFISLLEQFAKKEKRERPQD